MAVREVRMCDRKDQNDNLKPCPSAAVCTCIVCERDVCQYHKDKDDFRVRVECGDVLFGLAVLGPLCRQCGAVRGSSATQDALRDLLAPLCGQIVEILHAQQTAEALK